MTFDEILAQEVGELLAILNLKYSHHGFGEEIDRQVKSPSTILI